MIGAFPPFAHACCCECVEVPAYLCLAHLPCDGSSKRCYDWATCRQPRRLTRPVKTLYVVDPHSRFSILHKVSLLH